MLEVAEEDAVDVDDVDELVDALEDAWLDEAWLDPPVVNTLPGWIKSEPPFKARASANEIPKARATV